MTCPRAGCTLLVMRTLSNGPGSWGVLLALFAAGCGGTSAPPTLPDPHPETEAAASWLVSEELPTPVVRAPGPVAHGTPVFQTGHDGELLDVRFSPDGTQVLVANTDGEVGVLDFATGVTRASRRMWVSPNQGGLRQAEFDVTGTRVLLVGNGPPYTDTLFLWDLLTDTLVPGNLPDRGAMPRATLTADGSLVVSVVTPVTQVRDASNLLTQRSLLLRLANGQPQITDHVWVSPTNRRMVGARNVDFIYGPAGRSDLLVYAVDSLHLFDGEGALVAELFPGEAPPPTEGDAEAPAQVGFQAVGFRPGGGMLMTLTSAGVVQLRHPESGDLLHEVALPAPATDVQWSRGGDLLFAREAGAAPRVHFVDPASGAVVGSVTMDMMAWPLDALRQADGGLLVFSVLQLVAFSGTGEPRPHPLAPFVDADIREIQQLRITPGGERAVYRDGMALRFLDLTRGREVARRELVPGPNSVWGGLVVPGVGVLMTARGGGVLFRSGSATPVHCAVPGARLLGAGSDVRVYGDRGQCGLDDAERDGMVLLYDSERGNVSAVSEDGTTRLVQGDTEVAVEDVRTQRVRMRVPAADRTPSACPECSAYYQLSPNGGLLSVSGNSLPLAVFDTRTGRRIARAENAGRYVTSVTWSLDGGHFAAHWSPGYDPEGSAATADTSAVTLYDRRGRALTTVEANPEDSRGARGAVFSSTHAALFEGSRVSVVELGRGTVTVLQVAGEAGDAEWLGTTLRLWVHGEDTSVHALYAAGSTTPFFQHEGPGTFSADARWVFRCREGELERLRVEDLTHTSFGACIDTTLFPSADGRYVALPQGDHLRVVREDGAAIRLAVLSDQPTLVAYVVEEGSGRFQTLGVTPEETRLRYRQPGPALTAPVVPLGDAAAVADATVLQRFFGL